MARSLIQLGRAAVFLGLIIALCAFFLRLRVESRAAMPIFAALSTTSQGYYPHELGLPPEERYWPETVAPSSNTLEEALHLLKKSGEQSATIIGIGPYTNLYLFDLRYPGILSQANLFLMGGYVFPSRPGFPNWGNDMDFNIQVDIRSAKHVLENSSPTLVPLSVTVETSLRRAHLDDLRMSGALGQLIARQAEAFAEDERNEERYGQTCEGLPRDIINFQHDPLACAIALGWDEGVEIIEIPLILEVKDGWLCERINSPGKLFKVVTKVDAGRFSDFWVNRITKR